MSVRNTTQRDRDRGIIRRTKPPCAICDDPIDYSLPHTDPKSYVVDHVLPLALTGPTGDVLENKQAAHRDCNRAKSDRIDGAPGPRTFVTSRSWSTRRSGGGVIVL